MKQSALAAYGALGLPLAMAMLPIYVLVPNFYAADLGLGLALTGSVLFLARLLDTVQDPWLGRLIDRRSPRGWTRLLASSALLLSLAMAALLVPLPSTASPSQSGWGIAGPRLHPAQPGQHHLPGLGRAALRSA